MTAYDQLKLELDGIESVITRYTGNGDICNYLNKLKDALHTRDYDAIIYCLKNIDEWYDHNINSINTNEYVNSDERFSHAQKRDLIKNLRQQIGKEGIPAQIQAAANEDPIIFLSHRSSDKPFGDALRDFICGLGVKNDQLVYTSHPLHKVPMGKPIYDYLREKMNSKVFVIILWSDEYLESPACLNEMGAAWVTQSDYTNIYVPTFSFGNPKYHQCAVDTRKMGAVLSGDDHCKMSMIELKDKIQGLFNLPNDEKQSQYLLDNFIKQIIALQK